MGVDAAPVILLFVGIMFALWIYWPGQYGPALLDDHSSVLVIEDLRQEPETALDYVFGDRSGPLGRPVSLATFVLERTFFGDELALSKRVNIALHLLNTVLVTALFTLLLRAANVRGALLLATTCSLCWALAPLHVSSVLYVVQRMALLSGTFMLLATLSYVCWRNAYGRGHSRPAWLLLMASSIFLGLFSKENAVVVIPVILLVEALWYQFRDENGAVIKWLQKWTLGSIVAGMVGLFAIFLLRYEKYAQAFRNREFTLEERLMTQARLLWDYLAQLVWPDMARLGIYHDDVVFSTSLTIPGSTAWAIMAWLAVGLCVALSLKWRWGRRFSLGVAWYIVAHGVESSVLPLELYFEHRNYFPSVGIFLVLAVVLAAIMRYLPEVKAPLVTLVLFYAFYMAMQTSSQAQVWSQRELIIMNQLNGHPESPRANRDMAVLLANNGEYDLAAKYSHIAFQSSGSERRADFQIREMALKCLAGESVDRQEIEKIGDEGASRPISTVVTLHTFVRLLQDGRCPGFDTAAFAGRMRTLFLVENFRDRAAPSIYKSLAALENLLEEFRFAYLYTAQYLSLRPDDTSGQLMQLHFATALGKVDEARVLKKVLFGKQERDLLSVAEQRTLSLYLE
ncbi:hypothetical protein [Parahaliea mediterranea]|uniref:Tetratricopeptide repeat protein n=1 Tax=Parahaliea mediterranea TaxID=651086 RepID=A0A939DC22_9GAMM|nr:hypothetical protein [Parahaliea mediterranea]MBN7795396.1 hypothetical protein [Parahaliea mediterranea]